MAACSDGAPHDRADAPLDVGDVIGADVGLDAPEDAPQDAPRDTPSDISDGGDAEPPTDPFWPDDAYLHAVPAGPTSVRLEWTPAQDSSQVAVYEVYQDGVQIERTHGQDFSHRVTELNPLQEYGFEVIARDDENNPTADSVSTTFKLDVPAPEDVAPQPNPTRPRTPFERTSFLFEGDDPLQRDVEPGSIEERRIARISGDIVGEDGDPLAGVHVSVHKHPEWGYTLTRPDGEFDLAVNGGGQLTVVYKKDGYLTVHRKTLPHWQSSDRIEQVVMLQEADATSVDPSQLSVVRGQEVTGPRGTRQGTLIFHAGTTAEMVLPDGTRQPLNTLDVRITEYTVGDDGPSRMPADLPPTVAYTYAVEISVDQARAAGAKTVEFNQPVPYYVENFLGFPVGEGVPLGIYNEDRAVWVPEDNGRFIEILSVDANGRAVLDVDGTGVAADDATLAQMQFTDGEREKLAQLYSPGDTLARVLMPHFSKPDLNHTPVCDKTRSDCEAPDPNFDNDSNCSQSSGSIIECHSQVLRESIPLTGVPFDLFYSTRYQYGYAEKRHRRIQMFDDGEPRGLLSVLPQMSIEGEPLRPYRSSENPGVLEYTWDGEVDGERVNGTVRPFFSLGFCYHWIYVTSRFGDLPEGADSGIGGPGMAAFCIWDQWPDQPMHTWNVPKKQLGGWSLGIHHSFDPVGQSVYRGDGVRRRLDDLRSVVETVAGSRDSSDPRAEEGPSLATEVRFHSLEGMDIASDGSLYFIANYNHVFRLAPDGRVTRVAGHMANTGGGYGSRGFAGDGGPAIHALLYRPTDVAVGPDDSLYIADRYNHRIRKITAEGGPVSGIETITTVVGSDSASSGAFAGDGGPATQARLYEPQGIDVGPDGTLYIADTRNHRIRQVTPDGRIDTVAGSSPPNQNGQINGGFFGDGGPSRQAELNTPTDVVFRPNTALYVLDRGNDRVRKLEDGVINTVAGNGGSSRDHGDGPATGIDLYTPRAIAVDGRGRLYIAERDRVRVVEDGASRAAVGGTAVGYNGDGKLPRQTEVSGVRGLAVNPNNGSLYFGDDGNDLVRTVGDAFVKLGDGIYTIPSADGERVYEFDRTGRHLRTKDAYSGDVLYSFGYTNGLLTEVEDRYQRTTRIERDSQTELPSAIIGPFGHRTELTTHPSGSNGRDGYLKAVTNPAGERFQFDYYQHGDAAPNSCSSANSSADTPCCSDNGSNCAGLLKSYVEPKGSTHQYTYDDYGRLTKDEGPGGFSKTLARTLMADSTDYSVDVTTARGATTTYNVEYVDDKSMRYTEMAPTGEEHVRELEEEQTTSTLPDGTTVVASLASDPRFDMHAPYASQVVTTLPSGTSATVTKNIEVTMENQAELMSLETHTVTTTVAGDTFQSKWELGTGDAKTVTTTTPEGRTQTMTYDEHDRVTKVEVPGLEPISYEYEDIDANQNAHGRLLSIIQGDPTSQDARRWDYAYEQNASASGYGLLDAVTSPWTNPTTGQRDHTVSYSYDTALRTEKKTFPDNSTVDFGWDKNGNLTSLTPPGRSAHQFGVDQANLDDYYWPPTLSSGEPDDAYQTDYEFNEDYLLEKVTHADGDVIDYVYEPSTSRLDYVTVGTDTYDYVYAPDTGQLTSVEMSESQLPRQTLGYTWDGPLLKKATWTGAVDASVERTYDNQFRVASRTVTGASNSHTLGVTYKPDGMLASVGQLSMDYFQTHGMLETVTLSNTEASYTYNGFGEPETYTVTDTGQNTALFDVGYTYDTLGRIETLVETTGGQTNSLKYRYDRGGRLIEVLERDQQSGAYNSIESYGYDANGNRTSVDNAFDTLTASDITVDAQDRLTTYGDLEFTYTDAGELLTKTDTVSGETTTYHYDALGNLRRVELPGGGHISYIVDGIQRRVGRQVYDPQGTLTDEQYWVYKDALNPVAELDGQGRLIKRFVYASKAHSPDYMVEFDPATGAEAATYRIVTDHLGSVRMVVDVSDGSVVQRMRYDAWGNVLEDTNEGFQPFGYAGGLYDPLTGLVRFDARDYAPRLGRWTTPDSIGFAGGQANLYAYVWSDPTNLVDPSGFGGVSGMDLLEGAGNFAAGFGDEISFGATAWVRRQLDIDDVVDQCSGAYAAGSWAGVAHGFAGMGVGAGKGLLKAGKRLLKRSCFEAGTPVLTEEGLRPIEDVDVGDRVWARDEHTGEEGYREVVEVFVTEDKPVMELELVDETSGSDYLRVTGEHPFRVRDKGWVEAEKLVAGDEVYTSRGGWFKVAGGTWLAGTRTVYNLEVDGFHTYFVGESGAWVHNTCAPTKITGYTRHGLNRALARDGVGVSPTAILNSVRNPRSVTYKSANDTFEYVGEHATTVLNRAGKVVTTWATSRTGHRLR